MREAVLAKYPNATVQRLETDPAGVDQAHIVTAAGTPAEVQVDQNLAVTGTRTGRGPGGGGCADDGGGSGTSTGSGSGRSQPSSST